MSNVISLILLVLLGAFAYTHAMLAVGRSCTTGALVLGATEYRYPPWGDCEALVDGKWVLVNAELLRRLKPTADSKPV